jgi:hypothetical protein
MTKIAIYFLSAFTMTISSCGADQQTVDKMADKVCQAMSKYKEEQPETLYDAFVDVQKVSSIDGEFKDVSDSQLISTLEKNCPDGYKKFMKLVEEVE